MAYSYSIDDPAKNSKRTLAFILTVLIHVVFFWILASGLGAKMVQTVMGPVETKMIEELPDDDKEPPPPPPDIEQPRELFRGKLESKTLAKIETTGKPEPIRAHS